MALPPSTRKIPIIGGTIYNIGQVYDIVNTPCDPDAMLWVYGFFYEAPMIFAMLLLPDPIDFVQERFGKPHHRKRKYRGKAHSYKTPDINPGRGLGWAAWKMTDWVDRVGWYLLIADVSVQFAINWTSTVYKWAGCELPGSPYCTYRIEYGLEHQAGDWHPAITELKSSNIFRPGGNTDILVPPGYDASFTCALVVTPRPWPYNGQRFQLRIACLTTGETYPLEPPKKNEAGEMVASGIWKQPQKYDHARAYQLQVKYEDPAFTWVTKTIFSGYGSKKIEGLTPWLGQFEIK